MKHALALPIALLLSLTASAQVSLVDNEGVVRKGREFTVAPSGEATLTADNGGATRLKLQEIAEVVFEARQLGRADWELQLNNASARNRDTLAGKIAAPAHEGDGTLVLLGTDAGDLTVPLEYAFSLRSLTGAGNFQFDERGAAGPAVSDTLFIRREGRPADRDKGTVMQISATEVKFESDTFKAERTYKLADVEGILFASLKVAEAEPGLQVAVSTRNGMRVTGVLLEMTDKVCRVRTAHKTKDQPWVVDIQSAQVMSIHVVNGNLVYLSDMTPRLIDTPHEGILDADGKSSDAGPWFFLDRMARANKPIEIGGKRFRKGIATRKRVELEFDLGGNYSKFHALVGLTSDAAPTPSAVPVLTFVVRADGREVWRSKKSTWESGAEAVSLPVNGVGKLLLSVEYADDLDTLCYGAWADARVVK